ncbi:hypothetical protein [Rhodoblastus sp.]|uniref:hypothetical protein n=1 Tax=Rhodoblastus sp. TaxID=1962975 RepID=UPI0026315F10|nr:hypothetical protein [Rhodoblastus sp.]
MKSWGAQKASIARPSAALALRLQKLDDLQARLNEGLLRVAALDGEKRRLRDRTPFLFRREPWLSERNFAAPSSGWEMLLVSESWRRGDGEAIHPTKWLKLLSEKKQ